MTALDLAKNTGLVKLDCGGNALKALDLKKTANLTELSCGNNALTHLFLGNCTALKKLDCKDNALTGLDLSACTGIGEVVCANNSLAQLDATKLPSLTSLDCSGNALKTLNVSCNAALVSLDCSGNNALEKLWLKDSAQQDALALTKDDATAIFFNNGGISIPDAALKSYLLNIYDDDEDGQISIAEADNIIAVNCSGKGVTDLTGLECCTNLVTVNCADNAIAEIDLHTLTQLRTLNCAGNPVRKLVLDNCAALQNLLLQGETTNAIEGTTVSFSAYTQATTFDFSIRNTPFTGFVFKDTPELTSLVFDGDFTSVDISGNTAVTSVDLSLLAGLTELDAHGCALQSLDVTKNLALESLDCSGNSIPSLNMTNNTALKAFNCSNNNLTKINVTANTALEDFDISGNGLSAINLRSNTALRKLNLSYNKEISLVDLRNNTELTHLYVAGLSISELDLTNNAKLERIDYHENPNLISVINGGILIDGLTWALCNVGTSLYPEEYGNTYNFEQAQTVCPSSWRTPTREELQSLSAHYSAYITYNGVKGRWFSGSNVYSESAPAIFLSVLSGSLNGGYWSSEVFNIYFADYLRALR